MFKHEQPSPLSPYESLFLKMSTKEQVSHFLRFVNKHLLGQLDIATSHAQPTIYTARAGVNWKKPYFKQTRAAGNTSFITHCAEFVSRWFDSFSESNSSHWL